MTFIQALNKLKETRTLSTNLLEPLHVSFEFFLRFAQLSDKGSEKVLSRLIEKLESKAS